MTRDFISLEENSDKWDKKKNMINFAKRRLLGKLILSIVKIHRYNYHFQVVKTVQRYIRQLPVLSEEDLERMILDQNLEKTKKSNILSKSH